MNRIKLTFLSLLWIAMLPAMEANEPQKKRIKLDADAQVSDVQMEDNFRDNIGDLACLPDELLVMITSPRIEEAQRKEMLLESIKLVANLKCTCKFWNLFLHDQNKQAVKSKLVELGYTDIKESINKPSCSPFVIRVLGYVGYDVNQWRDDFITIKCPLIVAACAQRTDIINVLINMGADIDRTYIGKTPLFYSAQIGDIASAQLLINRGANVNADVCGTTILHWVAKQGNAEMVNLLITHGANTYAVNRKGQTPLDCAMEIGDDKTIALLTEAMKSTINLAVNKL